MAKTRQIWPRWYTPLERKKPSIRYIALRACDHLGVDIDDLRSPKRHHNLSTARHAIWYVAGQLQYSRNQIGAVFGRDASTVTHGIQAASYRVHRDRDFLRLVKAISA